MKEPLKNTWEERTKDAWERSADFTLEGSAGGWGETPVAQSAGGWDEAPVAPQATWDEMPVTTATGGWDEEPVAPQSAGGWNETPVTTVTSGWPVAPATSWDVETSISSDYVPGWSTEKVTIKIFIMYLYLI